MRRCVVLVPISVSLCTLILFPPADSSIAPIAGTLIMLLPLWGLIQPGQARPFNLFPWIALSVLALSVIYGIVIERLSPGLAGRIGAYVADDFQ